jgi:methane/ammonia monooxygenase subunit A
MALEIGGKEIYAAAKLSPEAAKMSRMMDLILVPTILMVVIGSFHLHVMLTVGDWDFWLDWKDREWWPLLTPVMTIFYCGAIHYILWEHFRLPIGATLAIAALLIGEWMVRFFGFHMWSNYPVNFMMPASLLGTALLLDATQILLRGNWVLTGIIGGTLYAALFYPHNYPIFAIYHEPVNYHGTLLSLADLLGFMNIRTGTPEYIRMIETGSLRTFGGHTTAITAAFATFLSILAYWVWWFIGKGFSVTTHIVMGKGKTQEETEILVEKEMKAGGAR